MTVVSQVLLAVGGLWLVSRTARISIPYGCMLVFLGWTVGSVFVVRHVLDALALSPFFSLVVG